MRTTTGRRYLALAWLSLVVFVVLVAWTYGQGTSYEWTGWTSGPANMWSIAWTMLAREIPGLVAVAAPGVAAWIFGRLAVRAGDRRGAVPAWIGLTVAVGITLLNVLAVLPLG